MKKLFVFLMVLAFVAPAMAADNLSVSGQMRVRTWDKENYDLTDEEPDKDEYVDQRFRLQATIQANDQVKAVTRIDLAEDKWGSDNWEGSRYGNGSELQVDRAYLDVTTGPVNIKAGQQYIAVGQDQVLAVNKPGLQITVNTPVIVEVGYFVDEDEDANGKNLDEYTYHLSLEYKADIFSVEGFYASQTVSTSDGPDNDLEDTKTAFGVNGKTTIGPVSLNAELAIFGGDDGAATATDYMGTQFNVDADMKISDMLKVGADLIWSDGTDGDGEKKITTISDIFGILARSEGGSGNLLFAGDLEPLGGEGVFDPFGFDQGALGLGVDAVVTPMTGLELIAHIMYLTASEDTSNDGGYDTALVYNLGVRYALAPSATLGLFYNTVDAEAEDSNVDFETATNLGGLLQISF